jgi:hypothetical protein
MKRLVLVLVIVMLPALAFADFQIGAVGVYNNDITQISSAAVSSSDFLFGLEARAKLWIFQVGADALYVPGDQSLVALTDAGLAFDILFLRLGAGIGPDFAFLTNGEGGTELYSWNMKLAADINLGNLAVGVEAFYVYDSPSDLADIGTIFQQTPFIGVNLLIRLF